MAVPRALLQRVGLQRRDRRVDSPRAAAPWPASRASTRDRAAAPPAPRRGSPAPAGQRGVPGPDLGPASGQQPPHEVQRPGNGEHRGVVLGPHPVELQTEARAIGARRVRAVADGQRADERLPIAADLEEGGALRGAEPLVAVAGVVGGAQRPEVEGQHPRRVRAVDQHVDARSWSAGHQRLHREDDPRRAGDVVEQRQAGPGRHRRQHRLGDLLGAADGEGDVGPPPPGPRCARRLPGAR